jgi:hypothetical protein
MKTGRTLQELAKELERQQASKKDYLAPQGSLVAVADEKDVKLTGFNGDALTITPYAHGQLSQHLDIPRKYYDRMRTDQPALLAQNVNTWLQADAQNKRMVRTLDGRVRGFLSSKFRPLDNYDLAETVLPGLMHLQAEIVSCELTETRMYVKAILPGLSDQLPAGMEWGKGHSRVSGKICSAITVRNSEIGAGTLSIEPGIFTPWCTNLAGLEMASMKKYHVGRSFDVDASYEVFRDETRQADDRAFFLKVRDVVAVAFSKESFQAAVAMARRAAETPIVSTDLPKVIEVTVKRLALPEAMAGTILGHLSAGGELTQWGLSSSITRTANDLDDYEIATEFEKAGGKVLALEGADWHALATAGA